MLFLLSGSTGLFCQNTLKPIDLEPYELCPICYNLPFIAPIKPIRLSVETDIEFNTRMAAYSKNVADINSKNKENKAKYVVDSLKRQECLRVYHEELNAWRKRNPNWKQTARNKNVIKKDDMAIIPDSGSTFIVTSQTANLRSKPNKDASILSTLKLGDVVILFNSDNKSWWKVQFGAKTGYVYSSNLKIDPYNGWEQKNYKSGMTPECENVVPKYDYTLDNYLGINVGSGTDVVVKLMKQGQYKDECVRIVYVRSNESFKITNIPEGKYFLKIAYGKDYRQKIEANQCYVKFTKNALYEKGSEILDFTKIRLPNETIGNEVYENWSLPSYELSLDVLVTDNSVDSFKSDDISEAEFNK